MLAFIQRHRRPIIITTSVIALQVLFAERHEMRWLGAKFDVPVLASASVPSIVLAAAAAVAVFRFKVGMVPVLLASSLVGVVYFLIAGGV